MHLSFLTSHNLLFFRFCKTSKKTTFSVFLSFFLVKSPKSQSLKLNISRTAWPILMILVSFCRILNGLSDEINLFWRCSSPLKYLQCLIRWKMKEIRLSSTSDYSLRSIHTIRFQGSDSCSRKLDAGIQTIRPQASVFVRAFHLLRSVSDENKVCSLSIRFFNITDPCVGGSFLLCSKIGSSNSWDFVNGLLCCFSRENPKEWCLKHCRY